MATVATRELRNDTASVLRRVQAGEEIIVTVNGKPVAQLVPLPSTGRRWVPAAVAAANRLPVVTQDDDFEPLRGVAGLVVIKV
jgi:prevent-host-death family protein